MICIVILLYMKHPDGDVEVKYSVSGVERVNQPQILENNVLDQWREFQCIIFGYKMQKWH